MPSFALLSSHPSIQVIAVETQPRPGPMFGGECPILRFSGLGELAGGAVLEQRRAAHLQVSLRFRLIEPRRSSRETVLVPARAQLVPNRFADHAHQVAQQSDDVRARLHPKADADWLKVLCDWDHRLDFTAAGIRPQPGPFQPSFEVS